MKNIKNIVIIILSIALLVSIVFNIINAIEKQNTTNENDIETLTIQYLDKIQYHIDNDTTDYLRDSWYIEELQIFNNIGQDYLSVLISNKDYEPGFIQVIAQHNGYYCSYKDICLDLIDQGLLVYVPTYEHPEHGMLEETIVTPYTIGYELAVEAGVIEEVK